VVLPDRVALYQIKYGKLFYTPEWVFTIFFPVDYLLRIISITRPARYFFSFLGIIDLLSIISIYVGLLVAGSHSFWVLRSLQLIRVFSLFKLTHFL